MHCPRCGQQQISDQTKFCSRCGFQLGLVVELLENGGFLPRLAELHKGKNPFFSRKNGVIFSILWFIVWVMMMPAFFGIAGADEVAAVSAVFGTFSTMMLLVSLHGNTSVGALPPQQSQPVSSYMPPEGSWRAPDTGDLALPGSVTEGTTKLLKKDQ